MKKVLILMIKLYQKLTLHSHTACRFQPTCSNYAIEALETHGFFKGSWLAGKRIIRCRPFGKMGYDPVPKRSRK